MPKEMDPKPLFDQLAKLQQSKTQLELAAVELSKVKPEKDEPVSFESLAVFRRGFKKLIEKGELDKNVQTAIIKKVVHKITIKPNGFEIHFHVGKTYYSRELGNHPSSRIFSFEKGKTGPSGLDKPAVKSQNFDFLKGRSSSLLTNGDLSLQTSNVTEVS